MPVVVTATLEPVRGCEKGGAMGDSHVCVSVLPLWVFQDIWGLVHTIITVLVDLVERRCFQLRENGTRMTTQREVLVTSLWWTMQTSVSVNCMVLPDENVKDGASDKFEGFRNADISWTCSQPGGFWSGGKEAATAEVAHTEFYKMTLVVTKILHVTGIFSHNYLIYSK